MTFLNNGTERRNIRSAGSLLPRRSNGRTDGCGGGGASVSRFGFWRNYDVFRHEENLHWEAMSENIMRIIDLRGKNLSRAELLAAMPRAEMGTSEATDLVRPIL